MKPHSDTTHMYGNKGFRVNKPDSEEPKKPKKRSEHKRKIASMKRNKGKWNISLKKYASDCYLMKKVGDEWLPIE